MKVLVLGSKGQLGRCLYDQLKNTNHKVVFTSRKQIDITDFKKTKSKILDITPDLVINATAYTSVDEAEEDSQTANLVNHLAVANIAKICVLLETWLIHVSTDYVFDGNSNKPYKENDKTNPQGVYGLTKLNGELAIQSSGCKHIIIRTAWVFSEYGDNFLKTMLSLRAKHDELSIVNDQIGCPTYAQDIAEAILKIIPKLNLQKDNGLYHFCGNQQCSWYDFAKVIFDQASIDNSKMSFTIKPIQTSDYPTLAKRPIFSVLDCLQIEKDFGVFASNWHEGIIQAIGKLKL
tara:strand:+ start:7249 stop:8121 length:873 start_codon:yes stop_codon:yes gene_type:complete